MTAFAAYARRNAKEDLVRRESNWFLKIKVTQKAGKRPEDESEKESCNLFRKLSENLHCLDIELCLWATIY